TPGNNGEPGAGDLTHQYVLIVGSLAITGLMITALKGRVNRLWAELSAAARTDMLTGFLNEQGFDEALATDVERARPEAGRIGLLIVHVRGLGGVSKNFGHATADELLREVGRLLDESTRRIDPVGRISSNVFGVVLPETDEHTGFLLGEQILSRIRRTYRARDESLQATIG